MEPHEALAEIMASSTTPSGDAGDQAAVMPMRPRALSFNNDEQQQQLGRRTDAATGAVGSGASEVEACATRLESSIDSLAARILQPQAQPSQAQPPAQPSTQRQRQSPTNKASRSKMRSKRNVCSNSCRPAPAAPTIAATPGMGVLDQMIGLAEAEMKYDA